MDAFCFHLNIGGLNKAGWALQASLGWVLPQLMEGYLGLAAGQVQDSSHFFSIRTAPMRVT